MSRLSVGLRVRVARLPTPRRRVMNALGGCVGDEGVVAGTVSRPNRGFHATGDYDVSVKLDRHPGPGMAPSYCFEPILLSGLLAADESIEEILPFLFEKERETA